MSQYFPLQASWMLSTGLQHGMANDKGREQTFRLDQFCKCQLDS